MGSLSHIFSYTRVHTPSFFFSLELLTVFLLRHSRFSLSSSVLLVLVLTVHQMGDTFFVASFETISNASEFFDSVVVVDEIKLVLAFLF